MPIRSTIRPNLYKDSVALMRLAETVVAHTGVKQATLLMGTPANKDILKKAGTFDEGVKDAGPSDVMIVVQGDNVANLDSALAQIDSLIDREPLTRATDTDIDDVQAPRSLSMALSDDLDANIAQISVPGAYAGSEAMKALRRGLNVFLFSDNVPLEQEQALKNLAVRKNLLVMGPDCGTAIIGGVPLGFANAVRRGPIGLVGASGTGLQYVSCRIHQLGSGISHAIGVGSRDVHQSIGGLSMLHGLKLLAADSGTKVIVIVSKPPAAEVRALIIDHAAKTGKPIVACFLDETRKHNDNPQIHYAATLENAAADAVCISQGGKSAKRISRESPLSVHLAPTQRYLRGLYSGGTFCYEAQLIWRQLGIVTQSNAPLDAKSKLEDRLDGRGHCALDLGSDEFTVGRPHPMIDYTVRVNHLRGEAADPSVAAIILDVVLGYGSHEDPARILAPAILDARRQAAKDGRELPVICFICGTDEDPQRISDQYAKLQNAGAWIAESSSSAARAAASLVDHVTVG